MPKRFLVHFCGYTVAEKFGQVVKVVVCNLDCLIYNALNNFVGSWD